MTDINKKDPHSREQGSQTNDNYTTYQNQLSIDGINSFMPKLKDHYEFFLDDPKVRRRTIKQPNTHLKCLLADAEMMLTLIQKANIDINVHDRQRWIHRLRKYSQHFNKIIYELKVFYKDLAVSTCKKLIKAFSIFLMDLRNHSREIPIQAKDLKRALQRTYEELKKGVNDDKS